MQLWILRWDIMWACHHEGPHENEAGGQSLRDKCSNGIEMEDGATSQGIQVSSRSL